MWGQLKLIEEKSERFSGVIGNLPDHSIQGDITEKVIAIKASGENHPNEVAENLIDGGEISKWLVYRNQATIEFTFDVPENVVKYALTSANDADERDPKDWKLLGSNDGENWTIIDEQTDQVFSKRLEQKIYEFQNDESYKYYKFDLMKNNGGSITQLTGIALSNGVDAPKVEDIPGMNTFIGDGPKNSYTGKKRAGWTSTNALIYEGVHETEGRAYSYNKLYNVNIEVESDTELSYMIHPEFVDKLSQDYSSTYVSLDLEFTDGTYLSELGAFDQYGFELSPQGQGSSNILYPNQWNLKRSNIGEVAEGKTIKTVLVAYDNPSGPGVFRGCIDDIKIEAKAKEGEVSSYVDYVNILRGTNSNGTFSRGNNLPAVAVPHGFNFWAPATNTNNFWNYSYQEANNEDNLPELEAFTLSHQPSPWMGDRLTFHILPSDAVGTPSVNRRERALAFSHDNVIAKPHYYRVLFENGIQTEITPTDKAAMFRFTFKDDESKLIFDNMTNEGGLTIDQENQVITGFTDVKSGLSAGATRMFIYATFDQPFIESGKLTGEGRDDVAGYVGFNTSSEKTVTMKIVTSLISIEQAKKNLDQDINKNDTFEDVMNRAKDLWNEKLSIIDVEGATREELVTVYSNMYRLFLYPNAAYENTGTVEDPIYKYASPVEKPIGEDAETETGAKINEGKIYVNNGFWDTYRTTWPAYALLTPSKAAELVDGFVEHYRAGGWISRWSSPGYADLMVGTSSDVAFADAYLKGITDIDVKAFYESAIRNAAVASRDQSVGRKGLDTSIFDGYTNSATGEGLSWAMDGYINDFAIAQLAKKLAEISEGEEKERYETDYLYYMNRAQNYVHLFNPETEFFMGRKPSGEWRLSKEEFDPGRWVEDYTETNAWNMAFHAPQDGQGLANLYGGREKLAEKLDKFFIVPESGQPGGRIIHEMTEARDVRMGMYAHSNQPSHHIIYMYNYAGQPWKAQEKISEVMSRLYIGSEIGQGYPGDEDNGEMSTWYLFTAAGFYPLQVGRPEYAIGAPKFKKMTIHLENGNKIEINAPKVSMENKYVQSLYVNGEPYNKLTLSHHLLVEGATLDFEMGSEPSTWGTNLDSLPQSVENRETDGTILGIDPLKDLATLVDGVATLSDGGDANQLFDNTSHTELSLLGQTPWIEYKFSDEAKMAKIYTITSGSVESEDPRSWKLIGSSDGETWYVLDERENVHFKWRKFTQPFMIENPGKYKQYRLVITDNHGASKTTIAEIELLGYSDLGEKFEKVQRNFATYVETGKVEKSFADEFLKVFDEAVKFIQTDQADPAVNYLEKLRELITEADLDNAIHHQLKGDINALIEATKKTYKDFSPENHKKYDGEVL